MGARKGGGDHIAGRDKVGMRGRVGGKERGRERKGKGPGEGDRPHRCTRRSIS